MKHDIEARLFALLLAWPLAACSDHGATSHRDPDAGHAQSDGGPDAQHSGAGHHTPDASAGQSDASTAMHDAGTTPHASRDGGAHDGSAPSSGPPCADPLPDGKACAASGGHCGGPCSNSWQMDYLCVNGFWQSANVVACGTASNAPQCRNSFSGGQLTPCCPEAKLDCSGKPDGWPGFGCTPGQDSFCSCICQMGQQMCGC